MTRQERLEYCNICNHRLFDLKKGIICDLTNDIADFEDSCNNYVVNEKLVTLEKLKDKREYRKVGKVKEKKPKKKHQRKPEKITWNDLWLIIAVSLSTTFIIRLLNYINPLDGSEVLLLIFLIIIIISSLIALKYKEQKPNNYKFINYLKFNILFSLILAITNSTYALFVIHKDITDFFCFL